MRTIHLLLVLSFTWAATFGYADTIDPGQQPPQEQQPQPQPRPQPHLPTPVEAACSPPSILGNCAAWSTWHWLRKARFIIEPSGKLMGYSSLGYSLTLLVKWIGGDAPVIEYLVVVAKSGIKAGGLVLALGGAVVAVGSVVNVGGLYFSMTSPAGGPGDDTPPNCAAILAPYDINTPEGLQKLLQLPEQEFNFVIRCIPPESDLGKFVRKSAVQAQQFENQLQLR